MGARPPLDPQARAHLDRTADLPRPEHQSVDEARASFLKTAAYSSPGARLHRVEDVCAPHPAGDISLRVYIPPAAKSPSAERYGLPVLVYFHGGGWVLGSLDTVDGVLRDLSFRSECAIVSVDYCLAPENKFPVPLEDAYTAVEWVAASALGLGIDPSRIAVGGDSAGGNLAAATAFLARDRKGPDIAYQLLIYPVTDHDFETPSYAENGQGYGLTRELMQWFWRHYVTGEDDMGHPYASVLRAPDLSGLPPATIVTAGYDVLRDEGRAYADALEEAGNRVSRLDYNDMIHGFWRMTAVLDRAGSAVRDTAAELAQALRRA
jgi:acetyl esterase